MNLAVDQPILNSPFEEPTRYWIYERESDQPVVLAGRRPAGYYFRARRRADERQLSYLAEEQFVQLELVNTIRHRVGEWRKAGYTGATPVTRQLLAWRFEQLTGRVSLPFEAGKHGRVAVKVIDQRGNEVMRVLGLSASAGIEQK